MYDKEVKGYIYVLEGTSATTKIHLPKDSRTSCKYFQDFLLSSFYLVVVFIFSLLHNSSSVVSNLINDCILSALIKICYNFKISYIVHDTVLTLTSV